MTFIDLSEEAQLSVNDSLQRSYVIIFLNKFLRFRVDTQKRLVYIWREGFV
jgi:hypothetical protein